MKKITTLCLCATMALAMQAQDFNDYFCQNVKLAKIAEVVLVVLLLIGGWIFLKTNPFNWNFAFWDTGLKIENTANVGEQMKKISEFTTVCYYEEAVIKNEKQTSANNTITDFLKLSPDSIHEEIVIIAKGKVRAGFDLSKIKCIPFIINNTIK